MTRRPLIGLVVSAVALLTAPSAARAGSYDVLACDVAPGGVNRTWTFENNAPASIQSLSLCPSSGTFSGLVARTILSGTAPETGDRGQWVFRAPAGTTISRVRLVRWLGIESGSGWRPFGRQADGNILSGETCNASGTFECNVGGYNTASSDHTVKTGSIAYGIECISVNGCTTGSSIHAARAAIYSARVTLSESTPPTVGTPTGPLVTDSGYHRGTESATFTGSDSISGLSAQRVYIDGIERASRVLACDYANAIPCSTATTNATLSVDLAATSGGLRLIPDGEHSVQVAAVDAAGNETRSPARLIVVDATAPAAPSDLASSVGSNWQSSRDFTATWTHPAAQVAPIHTAHWSLCPQGTTTGCTTGSGPVSASTGTLSGLQVPGEGSWDFVLRLEDTAGNTTSDNVARTVIRYDGTAPAASPNLGLANRADTTQSFLAWFNPPSDQQAPVTEAQWTLCPQDSGSNCTSGRLVTDPHSTNYLNSSIPSYGNWMLTVRLRDAAGNLGAPASTSLRYSAPVPVPTPTPTLPAPPAISPTPSPAPSPSFTSRASARLRVTSAVLHRGPRTLTVKGRTAAGATGALRVVVTVTRRGGSRTLAKRLPIRDGRFAARLRLSRTDVRGRVRVSADYPGSRTHAPARTRTTAIRMR